jgi:hypothetical protein
MNTKAPDWSRPFDDPVVLLDGCVLRTLHDAGQTAAEMPIWRRRVKGRYIRAGRRAPRRCTPIKHTNLARGRDEKKVDFTRAFQRQSDPGVIGADDR